MKGKCVFGEDDKNIMVTEPGYTKENWVVTELWDEEGQCFRMFVNCHG